VHQGIVSDGWPRILSTSGRAASIRGRGKKWEWRERREMTRKLGMIEEKERKDRRKEKKVCGEIRNCEI